MPKLWTETIEGHREAVRTAVLDAAAKLVDARGLRGITMSAIAEETGIGRATLYKYFPDVDAILSAWHARQVATHLDQLTAVGAGAGTPLERLTAALAAYAQSRPTRHGGEVAAVLHNSQHARSAQQHLAGFVRGLIRDAAAAGEVRTDVPAAELAAYCLSALEAAGAASSAAAVRRLVELTLSALQPPR